MQPVWAITVPASDELLALDPASKAAFLYQYESQPIRPGQWEWRTDAVDDAPAAD